MRVFGEFLQFGQMLHELIHIKGLTIQSVVPSVESNAVVVDDASKVDLSLKVPVSFMLIQLILVGLHHCPAPPQNVFFRFASSASALPTTCIVSHGITRFKQMFGLYPHT